MDFVGFGRVVSLSIVFAVIDVVIVTAIATLGALHLQRVGLARGRPRVDADRRLTTLRRYAVCSP